MPRCGFGNRFERQAKPSRKPAGKEKELAMTGVTVCITDITGEALTLTAREGQSLMEIARDSGVAGIVGDCGGGCACATCHVYVAADWWDKLDEPDGVEDMMLDMVDEVRTATSRLGCQIRLEPQLDGLTVTVAPEPPV